MSTLYEVLMGATDIPIAIVALLIGLIMAKKGIRPWSLLFFLITVSGGLGAVVHIFDFPELIKNIIWMVLFIFLFELVRCFSHIMCDYVKGAATKEKPVQYYFEIIMYVMTVIWWFFVPVNIDYVFLLYAAVLLARIIAVMIKSGKAPRKAKILVLSLIVPVAVQSCSKIIPYAEIIEHLVIVALMLYACSIAFDYQNRIHENGSV